MLSCHCSWRLHHPWCCAHGKVCSIGYRGCCPLGYPYVCSGKCCKYGCTNGRKCACRPGWTVDCGRKLYFLFFSKTNIFTGKVLTETMLTLSLFVPTIIPLQVVAAVAITDACVAGGAFVGSLADLLQILKLPLLRLKTRPSPLRLQPAFHQPRPRIQLRATRCA